MRAAWQKVLHYSAWLGVEGGLNHALTVNPDSGVQKVNTPGDKVKVDTFFTLELNGWMEVVQEIYKLKQLLLCSSPEKENNVLTFKFI